MNFDLSIINILKFHKYHFNKCIILFLETLKFNFFKPIFFEFSYYILFLSFNIYLIFDVQFIKQRALVQISALAVYFLESLILG